MKALPTISAALLRIVLPAMVISGPSGDAAAQREPVLRQIRVPHSYYYRESYLPQLTSGPSAATWSPDGRELIYSMQGTLWRQRPESDSAVQLTDGPGYHYQPDWSPDGRRVVFVSYYKDAMQLRVLDLATGTATALVDDGAVNVEPRWSPDGRRLAWVSTAFEGRWHIFTANVEGNAPVTPQRITEDRHSGLPRYYYSMWDHYLSPTWSADGRDLLIVSNRGRIWGSGGLWRMEARAGAPLREVHYEETTWRARPDWARDGRRVVYSSYAGRQWNQLALLNVNGPGVDAAASFNPADVFQLTYGEFDVTNPRWSPDGGRIALISNETGNTTLRVLEVPGGAQREVRARHRVRLRPSGVLRLMPVESPAGGSTPARLSVRESDGRHYVPETAWAHADDAFDRRDRSYEFTWFHSPGRVDVEVPAGAFVVEALRGLEYAHLVRNVTVRAGETTTVRLELRRLDNPALRGWMSGDLHVHMNYTGTYRNTPARLAAQARAEGLELVENLIVNKESRIPDIAYFSGRPTNFPGGVIVAHDEEFHTSFWGHSALLGLGSHVVLPNYAAYTNTAAASLAPANTDVFNEARRQRAVIGYVHPFDVYPDPADTTRALSHAFPVDVALGMVDYYEAVGFNEDAIATQRVWYHALNNGFRIAAGAGTDAMANYASLRGPVGQNRTYVRIAGTSRTQRTFLDALKAGRSVATNAPLLEFTLGGVGPGGEVRLAAAATLRATVKMRSIVPIDLVEVVRNGEVVATVTPNRDRTSADTAVTLPVPSSGWYLLRARSLQARHPVLDYAPFGTTSPVYVTVGGRAIRSRADAEYFIRWIARLERAAESFTAWNTPSERSHVMDLLARARRVYEERSVIQ
ncbi:MAG: CehA/McbA family metallohydrolase [Gemmatimonadota bacterium]